MQSQCSNKKQTALTHRAAYLEPAENTLIQCCCWLRATPDQEPGCFHQWVGAAGVEWTAEVWCTSGRQSGCSKLSLLSLLKRIYSNKKLHLGPEHWFQPFPSLLFSHSPLFIAHETSAAAFPHLSSSRQHTELCHTILPPLAAFLEKECSLMISGFLPLPSHSLFSFPPPSPNPTAASSAGGESAISVQDAQTTFQ